MYLAPMSCYALGMLPRSFVVLAVPLFLLGAAVVACGDDDPAEMRPEDGSVDAWGPCEWEGNVTPALCADGLDCSDNAVCVPLCNTTAECEPIADECKPFSPFTTDGRCVIHCLPDESCPETGGALLKCDPVLKWCT